MKIAIVILYVISEASIGLNKIEQDRNVSSRRYIQGSKSAKHLF